MGGRVIAIARWFFIATVALAVLIAAGAWQSAGAQALPKTFHFPHLNLPRIGPPPRPHFGDPGYAGRPSSAYERITSFVSDIAVAANGTLTVHETIRVVALGHSIRHGIFRDLPAYDRDPHGNRSRLRLEILQVKRDGHDEPYTMEMLSHAWRVRIGDAGVEVLQGSHAYEIVYRTNRRIGFFGDYDELYWNVTGNEWRFTIEQAVVSIEFPAAAHILRVAAYTGPMGSRDQHAVAERRSDRYIVFRTTKALDHDEGLSVGAAIAKGAVVEPTGLELVSEFAHDYRDTTVVLIGLILLTAYYFIVWSEVGRDPDAGPVAPLYAPPAHISPAGARYIMRMGYDRKAFAATLISLAVKGVLTIEDEPHILQHIFTLTRGGHGGRRDLSPTEASVAATLFAEDNDVALTQDNQPQIARAISALKNALHYEFDANYFTTNSAWFGGGVVIVLLSAIAAAYFSDSISDTFLIFQFSAFFGVFAGQFGLRAARHWAATLARHGSRVFELTRALFWTAATLPPIAAVIAGMFFISDAMSPLTIAALAAEGFVACIFYELLKRPTAVGAKLRNELKGFRMFLEMTEKDRLELEHPVNVTPETFEKYLPYAIALDAENAWGHRFESDIALASTAALSNKGYQPGWYSGAYRGANFGGFASSLGSGLGSAAASATFRGGYGSGSGSGDGGSSGGGGGGGGGGGW